MNLFGVLLLFLLCFLDLLGGLLFGAGSRTAAHPVADDQVDERPLD